MLLQAKQRCLQRYDALWIVHTFSLRWRYLQHRRETRQRVYDQARLQPEPKPSVQTLNLTLPRSLTLTVTLSKSLPRRASCMVLSRLCSRGSEVPGRRLRVFRVNMHENWTVQMGVLGIEVQLARWSVTPWRVQHVLRKNGDGCGSYYMVGHLQALEEAIDEDKPGIRDCIDALAAANSMEVGLVSKAADSL